MVELWIGLAGGILIGSTGAGMGLLVTPLLICCGYAPAVAVGTGLGVSAVTKLAGAIIHHRLGHWPRRHLGILMAGGASGVAIPWCLVHLWASPATVDLNLWIKRLLAGLLVIGGLALLVKGSPSIDKSPDGLRLANEPPRRFWLFGIGAGVAALDTFTAAGTGSLLVPALASTTPWTVPELAAVSNIFGWMVGGLSVSVYAHLGGFDPRLFTIVLIGLLPGVAAGALLSRSISRVWFGRGLGAAALFLGVRFLLT